MSNNYVHFLTVPSCGGENSDPFAIRYEASTYKFKFHRCSL